MEVLQKLKNRTTIQFSNFTSGYLYKENKSTDSKRYMNPNVYCKTAYNRQGMGTT